MFGIAPLSSSSSGTGLRGSEVQAHRAKAVTKTKTTRIMLSRDWFFPGHVYCLASGFQAFVFQANSFSATGIRAHTAGRSALFALMISS
jgi:hypothetical protein